MAFRPDFGEIFLFSAVTSSVVGAVIVLRNELQRYERLKKAIQLKERELER